MVTRMLNDCSLTLGHLPQRIATGQIRSSLAKGWRPALSYVADTGTYARLSSLTLVFTSQCEAPLTCGVLMSTL